MKMFSHNGQLFNETEMKRFIHAYYNGIFDDKNDRHYQMQKLFPASLDTDSVVLDYGCGMGGISNLFA